MDAKGLTPVEAGRLIRVGRSTMYKLMDAGEIEYFTLPAKGRRVLPSSIDDYIERHRVRRSVDSAGRTPPGGLLGPVLESGLQGVDNSP